MRRAPACRQQAAHTQAGRRGARQASAGPPPARHLTSASHSAKRLRCSSTSAASRLYTLISYSFCRNSSPYVTPSQYLRRITYAARPVWQQRRRRQHGGCCDWRAHARVGIELLSRHGHASVLLDLQGDTTAVERRHGLRHQLACQQQHTPMHSMRMRVQSICAAHRMSLKCFTPCSAMRMRSRPYVISTAGTSSTLPPACGRRAAAAARRDCCCCVPHVQLQRAAGSSSCDGATSGGGAAHSTRQITCWRRM